jgi:hypothetical protein
MPKAASFWNIASWPGEASKINGIPQGSSLRSDIVHAAATKKGSGHVPSLKPAFLSLDRRYSRGRMAPVKPL